MVTINAERASAELLVPELEQMLSAKQDVDVRDALAELLDPEVADVLALLDLPQRPALLRLLDVPRAAKIFKLLTPDLREELLTDLDNEAMAAIFDEMSPDDRTELLEDMPHAFVVKALALMRPEERRLTQINLSYPEQSVGRLMTPDYLAVRGDWSVQQAMDHIRRYGRDAETIDTLYVVDPQGKLLDDIRIRQLILANPSAEVESLMDEKVVSLQAAQDREMAVRAMDRYDQPVLPVTDENGLLLGIVTFDDVADVAQEETTEDIQKMGAVEALDEPYISVPILTLFRKRGVWLSVLFLGEMLTATAMGYFNDEISRAVVLAIFLPLIISSGGNSGSQASTLIIRAMATREILLRDWFKVFRRELACGLLLGLLLGAIGFVRIHLWQYLGWYDYTNHYHLVALTVSISLIGVVLWGTIMGSMLPFLLRACKLDPATISAPFIATLVDVSGLIIYFTIALLLLRSTLLAGV